MCEVMAGVACGRALWFGLGRKWENLAASCCVTAVCLMGVLWGGVVGCLETA
jgi:hypothetical protein